MARAETGTVRVHGDGGLASGERDGGPAGASSDKLASRVARLIEAEVIRRGWPVGEVLSSEPVLRERYGVSRTVLREAARLLEHHQVARMRRGPGGGLVICAPDAEPAIRAVVIYIEYVGAELRDVLHARRLIEPLIGRLVAERLDEDGITTLRETVAAERPLRDPGAWAGELFHSVLSELTGNPVLQLFSSVLEQLAFRYVRLGSDLPREEILAFTDLSSCRHAEIVDAAVSGDVLEAQVKLIEHLEEVAEWLEAGSRREPSGEGRPPSLVPVDLGMGATLAASLAMRIYQDIVGRDLQVGAVLGSEAELMDRYGTSRAVLRAAVRLLENHSVAAPRRGPGGGLVVTHQEPRAAIDTTALYLAFRGVTAEDLRVVREALEVGVVARVAERHGEPETARRLEALAGRRGEDEPDFHLELAELAGNPVLTLFLRIIVDLSQRIRSARGESGPDGACPGGSGEAHGGVLEAIRAGDAGLAQRRMRWHLAH